MPKPPFVLATLHTVLTLFFMLGYSPRWFADIPYDCVYWPYLWISGPLVQSLAHAVQHQTERLFGLDQIFWAWAVVPGGVCLVLGGIQYWLLESWLVRVIQRRRRTATTRR